MLDVNFLPAGKVYEYKPMNIAKLRADLVTGDSTNIFPQELNPYSISVPGEFRGGHLRKSAGVYTVHTTFPVKIPPPAVKFIPWSLEDSFRSVKY
jgi:hypothetical protein